MHAGHDHVELAEQAVFLVERSVLEDVDLDAAQHPERRQHLVQIGDHLLLLPQPLGGQAAGDLEPRRVVGDRAVGVTQAPAR